VMQKLQTFLPKLETSWVDVAWVWNWAISWRSYRFASFLFFKNQIFWISYLILDLWYL
jgi:hypothetical protein